MKRRFYLVAFLIYWIIAAILLLLPGVVLYILTGKDVWNNYMDKMFTRFLEL